MAFTIRPYSALTQAMVAWLAANPDLADGVLPTDLTVGSLERSQLEAVAILLEEYDQRVADAIVAAVPEACFAAFGFDKLPATTAVGSVIFSSLSNVPYDVVIPSGAQLIGPNGVLFRTTAQGTIPSGQNTSASVPIQAVDTGASGNVAEHTITRLSSAIAYVDVVTNATATSGGGDVETDDARAQRFAAFLRTLTRGTKEALEFAAMTVPSGAIVDARAVEPFLLNPVPEGVPYAGLVWLFCDDGTTNTTFDAGVASELDQQVNGYVDSQGQQVPGYKSAGVIVDILKATPLPIYVRGTVRLSTAGLARWTDIQASLSAAVQAYFAGLRIAERVSYQNLVTVLTTCDPDIREVDLVFWREGDPAPGYGGSISADDIDPYNPTVPLSIGARARAVLATVNGVLYPEWVLSA